MWSEKGLSRELTNSLLVGVLVLVLVLVVYLGQ
jgi:hypothetical protein